MWVRPRNTILGNWDNFESMCTTVEISRKIEGSFPVPQPSGVTFYASDFVRAVFVFQKLRRAENLRTNDLNLDHLFQPERCLALLSYRYNCFSDTISLLAIKLLIKLASVSTSSRRMKACRNLTGIYSVRTVSLLFSSFRLRRTACSVGFNIRTTCCWKNSCIPSILLTNQPT